MLDFNVIDDLKEELNVLEKFINQGDTASLIEKAIELMATSI